MFSRRIRAVALIVAALTTSACMRSAPNDIAGPGVTGSTTSPTAYESDCGPAGIDVSLDVEHTGEISGRENVVFDVRNNTGRACEIDNYPTLEAVVGGSLTKLAFPRDPTLFSRGVTGPGMIPQGGLARFTITTAVNGCRKPSVTASDLMIILPGSGLRTLPFPKELATAGCPLRQGPIGPVTAS